MQGQHKRQAIMPSCGALVLILAVLLLVMQYVHETKRKPDSRQGLLLQQVSDCAHISVDMLLRSCPIVVHDLGAPRVSQAVPWPMRLMYPWQSNTSVAMPLNTIQHVKSNVAGVSLLDSARHGVAAVQLNIAIACHDADDDASYVSIAMHPQTRVFLPRHYCFFFSMTNDVEAQEVHVRYQQLHSTMSLLSKTHNVT
jgi:hypothetical protein